MTTFAPGVHRQADGVPVTIPVPPPSPGQVAWEAYTAAAGVTNGTTWERLPGDSKRRWEATAAAVINHHQTNSSEVPNA